MPLVRVNVDQALQVGDALVLEALQLIGEVADPVGQAVGQRRLAEAAVPAARPVRDGLRLEDDDAQRRVRVGQGDRGPQPGEPATDDDDIGRRVAGRAAARRSDRARAASS